MNSLIFHLFFLSLFIPYTTAHSKQQERELFKQLDQFIQFVQPNDGPQKKCQHCLNFSTPEDEPQQEEENDPLLYQCAVDLCGPSNESSKYTFLNNTTFDIDDIDPEITRTFNEKIRPVIAEAVNNQMSYRRQVLANWGELMQNPDAKITELEWDAFARELIRFPIERDIDWDENKRPILRYTIAERHMQDMSTVEQKGMMSYVKSKNETPPTADRVYAIKNDSNNTPTDISNKVTKLLREKYQRFLTEYDSKHFTEDENKYIQWLEEAMADDSMLNKRGWDIGRDLDILTKKATDHGFCFDGDCKKWVRDEITGLHQSLKQSVQSQADYTAQYIQYCRSVYTANILNTRKTRRYRENLPKYVDQFFNSKVFANYSEDTRRAIETDIKGKEFTLPLLEDDMQSYFIGYVNNENEYQGRRNKEPMYFTTILDRATYLKNNDNFGFCPDIREEFSKDRSSGRVSLFSCTFHEYGKQILAHEFGHALSSWFKKNDIKSNENVKASEVSYTQYTTLRRCATNRYETEERSGYVWSNDKFRTEEDTADLIAHLAFPDESTLVMCSLLKTSTDGLKYQDESIAIINPEDDDTHSARLLRVIIEAIHKGKKLSSTCQQVVDTYSKKGINFGPCPLN